MKRVGVMIAQVLIDSVKGVEVSAQSHVHAEGGMLILRVKSSHPLNGGEAATTAVVLETWEAEVWDHFRDIARALSGPLVPQPPSDTEQAAESPSPGGASAPGAPEIPY